MSVTVTVEKTYFRYDELTEGSKFAAQQSQKFWDWQIREAVDLFEREMCERGMSDVKVHYNLSYDQNQGVGFEGSVYATDIIDPEFVPILLQFARHRDVYQLGERRVEFGAQVIEARINLHDPSSNHAPPSCFGVDVCFTLLDGTVDEDELGERDDSLVKMIHDYFRALSRTLLHDAYELIDNEEGAEACFEGDLFEENGSWAASHIEDLRGR